MRRRAKLSALVEESGLFAAMVLYQDQAARVEVMTTLLQMFLLSSLMMEILFQGMPAEITADQIAETKL
jgi:hypothetical protein